jgi:hypothetical protein
MLSCLRTLIIYPVRVSVVMLCVQHEVSTQLGARLSPTNFLNQLHFLLLFKSSFRADDELMASQTSHDQFAPITNVQYSCVYGQSCFTCFTRPNCVYVGRQKQFGAVCEHKVRVTKLVGVCFIAVCKVMCHSVANPVRSCNESTIHCYLPLADPPICQPR